MNQTKCLYFVGQKLTAKPGCTVSLTPRKTYEVEMVNDEGIGITDDKGRKHLFYHEAVSNHLGRYTYNP